MTSGAPPLSVVVVSHGRPRALVRCLTSLWQMEATGVEVVVVADADGRDVARSLPFAGRLKLAVQNAPNISRARNDGIALAAGEIVAFLDDDAVAVPGWATAIRDGFAQAPDSAALSGPVIGRSGLRLQWGRMAVDREGRDVPSDAPGAVPKLHGTNMAVRRDALVALGGFDPRYAFYLDDTDLARRLAAAGHRLGWAPPMIVHHGYEESARRDAARVPLSLREIGASSAVFLCSHAPERLDAGLADLEEAQRLRLLRLVRRRKLDARRMRGLLEGLRDGMEEGRMRQTAAPTDPAPRSAFAPLRDALPAPRQVLSGWRWQGARLRKEAARQVAAGHRVDLILLEPTPRKHWLRFTDGGWWEQTGGLYGPAWRSEARFQAWLFSGRIAHEARRMEATRREISPR